MIKFLSSARVREGSQAARLLHVVGALQPGREQHHKLAWSLFQGESDRDFLFRVEHRDPLTMTVLSNRKPMDGTGLWDVETREADLEFQPGTVLDIKTELVLLRSARAEDCRSRGAKTELVAATVESLRSGRPFPEVEHLPQDARAEAVVQPSVLNWFCRAKERLGLDFVPGNDGCPMFLAESVPSLIRINQYNRGKLGFDGMRAVSVWARIRVADTVRFAATLAGGIGTQKAYGMGLVSVTPV